ncbi:putative tyrosinase-like protein [Botrytis fragariae]|uniref:Putative tyrosinase-like protein n=1 Tax=Botrytis fragariae TaxID=1964551 RepID=A0A8H6ANQ1_9HELO|nr:putative tyrosinase-like protein [Botrytis fragariae]KAF5870718.1 putative tyrosinase-like protein [Botrytis fragariae]
MYSQTALFFSKRQSYISLENSEDEELKIGNSPQSRGDKQTTVEINLSGIIAIVFLLTLSIISVWALFIQNIINWSAVPTPSITFSATCVSPPIRREWRILSTSARERYIDAVQCLTTKPFRVRNNGSLYDDFPCIHQQTAPTAHSAATFLAWHRYFIHVYEDALRNECSYKGDLPCVMDGPFAGLEAMFYGGDYKPHCLSPGFSTGESLQELSELIRPDVVDEIMQEKEFKNFAERLEKNAHQFVSGSIRGDFSKFTGPYDPVFFLHHANLDRLWWGWQQQEPENRLFAYDGKTPRVATSPTVQLADMLSVEELKRQISVREVMPTNSGIFCYQY